MFRLKASDSVDLKKQRGFYRSNNLNLAAQAVCVENSQCV